MDKIPFSVYDFFAYLSSGTVIILTACYIWFPGVLRKTDIGVIFGVVLIMLAYVLGHAVAHLSSVLFEHILVGKGVGRPIPLLMGRKPGLLKRLFPGYHRALAKSTQEAIKQKAGGLDCSANDEALFEYVFPRVTADQNAQSRVDVFLNIYGFARNMSLAFLLAALGIFLAHRYFDPGHRLRGGWAVFAAVLSLLLFYRYLKFFRQYAYELLLRYSAPQRPEAEDS